MELESDIYDLSVKENLHYVWKGRKENREENMKENNIIFLSWFSSFMFGLEGNKIERKESKYIFFIR